MGSTGDTMTTIRRLGIAILIYFSISMPARAEWDLWLPLTWPEAPRTVGADEVVLRVRLHQFADLDDSRTDPDAMVVIDHYTHLPVFLFEVVEVASGQFDGKIIALSPPSGTRLVLKHLQPDTVDWILVGQIYDPVKVYPLYGIRENRLGAPVWVSEFRPRAPMLDVLFYRLKQLERWMWVVSMTGTATDSSLCAHRWKYADHFAVDWEIPDPNLPRFVKAALQPSCQNYWSIFQAP